jgi:TonB-linked SusC/RagA family outer membrane protein
MVTTEQSDTKIMISGVVVDKAGDPLVGATIREKGTSNGAVTDMDGKFTLSVSASGTIVISYIGYRDKSVPVNGKSSFRIELEEDAAKLNEVVVVGYGVQKKVNLSGSVDQISAAQLEQRPIVDLAKGLQGMVPNLNIDFTSGEPGKAPKINIRGEASINGGSPLILIDGVASDADEMNRLLPEDVESLSVLKDASSAAIYGARAAFGVILITTKQGKGDRIQVSYNNNFSWKRPSSLTDKTSDPYIYLKLKNIAVLNTPWSSGTSRMMNASNGHGSVRTIRMEQKLFASIRWIKPNGNILGNRDWTDYFLDRNTFSQTHQVSISGATEKTNFYLSTGMDNEDGIFSGIVNNDKYLRYSMRGKVSYKVLNWLTISNNTSFVSTTRKKPSYYNLSAFYDAQPHNVDKNSDGTWANTELGEALAQLVDGGEEKRYMIVYRALFQQKQVSGESS